MEIRRLKPEQKKRAAKVVADSFYDYPSLIYYFPDTKRRMRCLPWYMEGVLNSAVSFGEVWVTEDVSGVLFILPPEHTRMSDWDYIKNGLLAAPLVVGLHRYPNLSECEAYLADTQEKLLAARPHYYLWGLSVDPARQRTGAGTALIASLLKKTDAENMPVYLETHREQNVAYYEQRGFKLIHTDIIPRHNLDFWCLLHEPGGK
ncbi:Acetyltransferase (GNAT) family protein [Sporobacter termitidis DSM 10068]|uniref:Acetyltransferase (GNAT) family protein n=1 Tax=Sporobacter termitidis DSM 10068 TaxID=1123282 RepID=A0A1M5XNW0_9FIRM|nr:GNAT family N-acetyltransferase [Sporobacter termitidis]SHI01342.1 Acetyltransferase (GNAT) family protein [Sporobacter termitidis DSM 10068]